MRPDCFINTGDSRPGIQRGHSMSVVCNLGGSGGNPQKLEDFFNFMALKWLKIDTKHLKNVKINNANLNYNFSPRLLKTYFSTGGPVSPLAPP